MARLAAASEASAALARPATIADITLEAAGEPPERIEPFTSSGDAASRVFRPRPV